MAVTGNTTANRSIAVAGAISIMVGLYLFGGILGDMSSFNDWDKPAEVKRGLEAGALVIGAFLLAMGVDVKALLGPFGSLLPGGGTVTQTSVKTETTVVTPSAPTQGGSQGGAEAQPTDPPVLPKP